MVKIDLHVHTRYSDGNLTLEEVLELATINNLEEIAITDHDTIINLKDYKELEQKYKIKIIPGVEIPADYKGMHILGYDITDFDIVEKELHNLKIHNENCNRETIDILKSNGINISFDEVKQNAVLDVVTYRDIVEYMVRMGYASEPLEVYRKYIGRGTKAYVPSKSLSMKEVLQLIEKANGISVLAHPFTLSSDTDFDNLIPQMKEYGLSGIEIYSPRLTLGQKIAYDTISKKYNLLKTIGTDFHDSNTDELGIEIEKEYLDDFHNKILRNKFKG